jgi:hypothetical protein
VAKKRPDELAARRGTLLPLVSRGVLAFHGIAHLCLS